MASSVRICGVNLPGGKKVYIALSYIFGIGQVTGTRICSAVGIDREIKIEDLCEDDVEKLRDYISKNFIVEGALRELISNNVKLKMSIGCYQGNRHRNRLPSRGQRTKTNAKTVKGRSAPIANKKVVAK